MIDMKQTEKPDYAVAARALLRRARYGILSTLSKQVPGYPFGSVLPCALTPECEPILCISTLAAHTQNILADPHVSFTVVEPGAPSETQAHARFVYLGLAEAVAEEHVAIVRERFVRLVPSAQMYVGFGDFRFYTLKFVKGRYIGGFGAIAWIAPEPFMQTDAIAERASSQIDTLNALCGEALGAYAIKSGGETASLAAVDGLGLDVQTSSGVVRLEFEQPLSAESVSSSELERLAAVVANRLASP